MKIVFLLIMTAAMAAGLRLYKFNPLEIEQFKNSYSYCLSSSKVNLMHALNIGVGIIEDSPGLKEFLFCANQQNGYQDDQGNFILKELENRMSESDLDQELAEAIIAKCTKKQSTPEDTAFRFLKCAYATIMKRM